MKYTQVTVFKNNKWSFIDPPLPVETYNDKGLLFYKMKNKFGLNKSSNSNPTTPDVVGNPGDFVVLNPNGLYEYMSVKKYEACYPKKQVKNKFRPLNSDSIR
jgi:hypothetical protein